jgi:putative membrane protein
MVPLQKAKAKKSLSLFGAKAKLQTMKRPWILHLLFMVALVVFTWSGWEPRDRPTWVLEVIPAWIGFAFILYYWKKFPLTSMFLIIVCIHSMILFMGGKYTYAHVPIGNWFRDHIGFERNNYDRLGHFFQGLTPAILAREILIRRKILSRGAWLNFFVLTICLSFSACYEFFEWWTALISGKGATEFLSTQGDSFDTQGDMFSALVGASFALIFLSRAHERALKKVPQV